MIDWILKKIGLSHSYGIPFFVICNYASFFFLKQLSRVGRFGSIENG